MIDLLIDYFNEMLMTWYLIFNQNKTYIIIVFQNMLKDIEIY